MGLLAAIANPWWISVYQGNKVVGLGVLLLGILSVTAFRRKNWLILFLILLVFLIFQFLTTNRRDLFRIANDDKRLIDLRLRAYPPISFAPIAYWLEMKSTTIVLTRMSENFFENLDINQYFFANHPRERVGHTEIQKILFVFLPFFAFGLISLSQNNRRFLFINLIGLVIISTIGNDNPWGNIYFYPLILISIEEGGKCIRKLF